MSNLQTLLAALTAINTSGERGFTTMELAEAMRVSQAKARDLVKAGIKAGKVQCCGTKMGVSMDGRRIPIAAYEAVNA